MDRNAFKASSFKDADNHAGYWKDKSCRERLAAAFFLIKHAYGLPDDARMDREVIEKTRRYLAISLTRTSGIL